MDCKENHLFDMSEVADIGADDAWVALKAADDEKDLDDLKAVGRPMTASNIDTDLQKGHQGVLQGGTGHDIR